MTLKELNFFYKLCENPQVTQVASELNISQSAISLAIKSLENSLNEQLFDRIGKKLILNEKGKYFKEKTLPSYLALMDASTIFQENKLAGNIKIAASKTISNYIMPNIYYDFLSNAYIGILEQCFQNYLNTFCKNIFWVLIITQSVQVL